MAQGKCSLLKPVDSLTGSFFTFSQYSQDLTKQYANSDSYRCVPSKFIALNLDYRTLNGSSESDNAQYLGEIFQNYFENACTYLRGKYGEEFNPEYTRTLLFQTLEKFRFLSTSEYDEDDNPYGLRDVVKNSSDVVISGISDAVQYIGDINIYSYDDNQCGVGYNEIYCYIPNEAKCTDYQLCSVVKQSAYTYSYTNICGYENQTSYNNLRWTIENSDKTYIDKDANDDNCYCIGAFDDALPSLVLVPQCLLDNDDSNDHHRTDSNNKQLDKFSINTIVVLYDIVRKGDNEEQITIYKNVPLGIYFTGLVDIYGSMSNIITKYVDSGQIYNQGTSYGLRVCTRFLTNVNSTEIIESSVNGSTNVAEMAPVLEKMGEVLTEVEKVLDDNDTMQTIISSHLSQFKNNKVNIPYVRQLGTRKYWFVNGKNTGAVAQYEEQDPTNIVYNTVNNIISQMFYTKDEITDVVNNCVTKEELQAAIKDFATKEYVDEQIEKLRADLLVYLQGQ